jgi:hypothetical protein
MENIENSIVSINIVDEEINILYDNDMTETLMINKDTYKKMRDNWLIDQPPFICDKYKKQMNNIILSVIQNKQMCIDELKSFFTQDNIEEVKNFLVYMRNRDLTEEKSKWVKK